MFALQRELGGAVIKNCFFPIFFVVAVSALAAQGALVGIVLFMATVALKGRIAEFFTCLVALFARQKAMLAFEQKVCLRMVKLLFIETGNVRCSSLVIGVADVARLRFQRAMKTGFVLHVSTHFFVAS